MTPTEIIAESAARRWAEFRSQRARHDALAHKAPVRGSLSRRYHEEVYPERLEKQRKAAAAILAMRGGR